MLCEDKDEFLTELAAFMSSVPVGEHDIAIILGDFNAYIGFKDWGVMLVLISGVEYWNHTMSRA